MFSCFFAVAGYLMELIVACKLDLKMGLVQTAYANGSSTKYIEETLVRFHFPFQKLSLVF